MSQDNRALGRSRKAPPQDLDAEEQVLGAILALRDFDVIDVDPPSPGSEAA